MISDEVTINYLTKLWNGIYRSNSYYIFNYIANIYYHYMNRFNLEYIKSIIPNLKKLGLLSYNDSNNNEQPIDNKISKKQLKYVLNFKNGSLSTRNNIMKKISNCTVFSKYKSGDVSNPDNFRYYINHCNSIKILDRLWYYEVIKKCGNNLPNPDIFKVTLGTNNSNALSITANNNTLSRDNVLLLDLQKAYDSLEWNVVEDLLYHSLRRRMNIFYALEFVQQYMIILSNRVIKYNNTIITVTKGIPTGLPSSILVFTLIIEEIITRWMKNNNFINNIDFNINIYVDDIYINFNILNKTNKIISSLITQLTKYKLYINYTKSKLDKNLYSLYDKANIFSKLKKTDLYLGIPFTRNIKLYSIIILQNLYKKHKLKYTWTEIDNILNNSLLPKTKKKILGFMNYKLKPLLNDNNNIYSLIHQFVINKY